MYKWFTNWSHLVNNKWFITYLFKTIWAQFLFCMYKKNQNIINIRSELVYTLNQLDLF